MNIPVQTITFAKILKKLTNAVSITGIGSISPLGVTQDEVWEKYRTHHHLISIEKYGEELAPVAKLSPPAQEIVNQIREENSHFRDLDDSVLFAIYASREAVKHAGWTKDEDFGVNVGSSRGATSLFEKYHQEFLETNTSSTLSSPTTTLGNVSSWIAHDLQTSGPEISHSITCSTALHALLNGVAWIQSGLTNRFLVGGSEAPLTPFTLAQIKALKIYASAASVDYPCQAMNLDKTRNSMFLGEGAGVVCLEKGKREDALAWVTGIGYATEPLLHNISISTNADCFQKSMKMALGNYSPSDIDAIVMHAPGTIKGDQSEYNAIQAIFGEDTPALTTNKWKIGHTFGASGILSLELGILMVKHQEFISVPYRDNQKIPQKLNKIMVNAVGFGGNAVTILIEKPVYN